MSAIFSPCGLYRLRLDRDVQPEGIVVALFGVNPSTAGEVKNDQTIRKDIGFAKVHGWRKIIKGNVFGYRATDVTELAGLLDPWGRENMAHVKQIIADADLLVPCWGARGKLPAWLRPSLDVFATHLRASGKPMVCFGLTASGDPKHPQMLGYNTPLVPWL